MKNEEVINRLLLFFDASMAKTERLLGLSNGTLGKFRDGKTRFPRSLETALQAKGLNSDYFLTGEGAPELSPAPSSMPAPAVTPLPAEISKRIIPFEGDMGVPGATARYVCIPETEDDRPLKALRVMGDAMVPTLKNGDIAVFDGDGWQSDGVYAVRMCGVPTVKRLTLEPGWSYRVKSDNPSYAPYLCPVDDLSVIGRVRYAVLRF